MRERVERASFAFSAWRVEDLPARVFLMPSEEILLVNPNTGTSPVFRSRRDAELTLGIYRRVPVLVRDGDPDGNPWDVSFLRMLDMANDSGSFRTREQLEANGWRLDGNIFTNGRDRYLPLYEAKMVHHFDHRFGTYEGQTQAQANKASYPRLPQLRRTIPGLRCYLATGSQSVRWPPSCAAGGLRTGSLVGETFVARMRSEPASLAPYLPSAWATSSH
jgi:hypothetical protein